MTEFKTTYLTKFLNEMQFLEEKAMKAFEKNENIIEQLNNSKNKLVEK